MPSRSVKKIRRRKREMREIVNLSSRILLPLVLGCLIFASGCGLTIAKKREIVAIPSEAVPVSHPTLPGYECFSTGYIQSIIDEAEMCLSE
jgi:hypothetical protein